MIPFLDLKAATDELRGELDAAVRAVLDSGWYVLGSEVEGFEALGEALGEAGELVLFEGVARDQEAHEGEPLVWARGCGALLVISRLEASGRGLPRICWLGCHWKILGP